MIAASARDLHRYRQAADDLSEAGIYMLALLQRARLHVTDHALADAMDEFLGGVQAEYRAAAADLELAPAVSGQEAEGASTVG